MRFGARLGETIKNRLADIRAATTISDVVAGNPREISRDGKPAMALDLEDGYVMVFSPNHLRIPVRSDSSVDWKAVSRIKILVIEASNG